MRRLSRRGWSISLVATLVAVLVAGGVTWGVESWRSGRASAEVARVEAAAFLSRYVDPDGRVVRRDQGGDTVSEGQAYALLLAVVLRDRPRFEQIWGWTQRHLQQPSGVLAWHWQAGEVKDTQSAGDADVDAAVALLEAGQVFNMPAATHAGRQLAAAVLDKETIAAGEGRLLVAGPWAVQDPATINPSYLAPGTATALAKVTGDVRWRQVATSTRQLVTQLVGGPVSELPPDWVTVPAPNGAAVLDQIRPASAPGGSGAPVYGYEAQRLLVRLATSCDPADRALAARPAGVLSARPLAGVLGLDGHPQVQYQQPLGLVAAAAAAGAGGHPGQEERLLAQAAALPTATSTYYGAAWLALGHYLLTTPTAFTCPVGS